MDIIEMTRELAKAVQLDERVVKYNMAREKSDEDETLQELIGKFNLKRIELNAQLSKAEKDNEKITQMDKEMKNLYAQIMQNENMIAYNEAKSEVDTLMNFVNQILAAGVNGEDPDTVDLSSCTHDCSTCGGCH